MKRILNKLMCAVLLPLGALAVSCTESDNWEPGAPDVANCYDVFFPEQENTGDLEVDPNADLEFTYIAQRSNTDGAITVPVYLSTNTDGLYTVSPIEFADGEDETSFTVTLSSESELSTKYSLEIDIVDPQYTPQYTTEHNNSLQMSITRVKWNEVASGTFISSFAESSRFWAPSTETKLYRKDESSQYKISNFIGLGADLFFTWNTTSNMCQIDGLVYTGYEYTHDDNREYSVYIMDGIGYFNDWKGNTYGWEILEQNGYMQPYYDPAKKAFFFHVYYGIPALNGGFRWWDEVFLLEGGSLGCDLALEMMLPSEFNPQLSSTYNDQENLIYAITGTDLTSLQYAILPTEIYNNPAAAGIEDLEAFLDEYGIDGSEKDSEGKSELDYIAEDGGYVGIWINREAGVSYTMFAKATNANGEDAFVTCQYSTAETQIEIDPTAPVQGYYTMTCSPAEGVIFTNNFSVIPRENANEFFVEDLGYDGMGNLWYATYDETASTLTLNGIEKGYEDDGNAFGILYGYTNSQRNAVYGFFSFASAESDGDDPCVFSIDPVTKKLSKLNTQFCLPVFDFSTGQAGSILGYLGYYAAETPVQVAAAGASATSVRVANIPFSSVRNIAMPKMNIRSSSNMLNRSNIQSATAKRIEGAKFSIKSGIKSAKLTNAVSKL